MKPIKLILQAFGPFSGQEQVDFTKLGASPLFLINGPTGSGKSSILDAICFALYGETTGSERTGDQMRCDHAEPNTLTEVSFEFSLGSKVYKVVRTPDQEVPKKRGDGTTKKTHTASLYLVANGEEQLIASRPTAVSKEMLSIIGLDVKQFRQVMVLPQGKFRELLTANSKEREQIFGQLFQTHIYTQIEKALFDRAAGIRKEKDEFDNQIKGALDVVSVNSEEELQAEKARLAPILSESDQQYQNAQKQLDHTKQQHSAALELSHQFAQKAKLDAELKEHLAKREGIDKVRLQKQQAQKAMQLDRPYDQMKSAEKQCETARNSIKDKSLLLEQAQQQLKDAESAYQAAAKNSEQVSELNQQLFQLESVGKKFAALNEQQKLLESANQAFVAATSHHQKSEQTFKHLDTQLQAKRTEREQAQQQSATLDGKRLSLTNTIELIDLRLKHQQLIQRQNAELQRFQQVEKQYQAAQEQTNLARQTADKLEFVWHSNQAAELAARLTEGDSCPVCGSHTHPQLAQFMGDAVTKDQVQQAREYQQQQTNRELEQASLRQKLESDLQYLQQEAAQVEASLQQKEAPDLETLQQRKLSLENEIQHLSAIDLVALEDQLRQLEIKLVQAQQEHDAQGQNLEKARRELTEAETKVASLQSDITSDFTHVDQVRQKYSSVQKQIQSLTLAEQQARTRLSEMQNLVASSQSAHISAKEQLRSWTTELEGAQAQWEHALAQTDFHDVDAYLKAKWDEAQHTAADGRLRQFDELLATLKGRIDNVAQALEGKEPPNLASIESELAGKQKVVSGAFDMLASHRSHMNSLVQVEQKLARLYEKNAELEKAYQVYGTLSDIANGRTGAKVSLHRFVLGVLLDDVLIQASQRLRVMTKGRYELRRKEDRAKGNAGSGLDLMVEDGYTGKLRDVATLSGGESFMAALALALGLSDVVQSYSGGIRLDTLFIDEGFGSLDPESLELAIQTLIDLQQGGRTIGIISHVSELKEQMALRVDVSSSRTGSKIKVLGNQSLVY